MHTKRKYYKRDQVHLKGITVDLKSGLYRTLSKDELGSFFEGLKRHGSVYGPVKISEDSHAFRKVDDLTQMDLGYTRTLIPPKKFFIKPREDIFLFDEEEATFKEPPPDQEVVVFGVHACDINALNLLARVFLEDTPDRYYRERRERTLLVGLSCVPDENCFCRSTGTSHAVEGFDVFLNDLGDKYLVRVGSTKGYGAVMDGNLNLEEATQEDLGKYKAAEAARDGLFKRSLDVNGLQTYLDLSYDDPLWKEYGDRCLSCGSCNLVCPRCRCYDIKDYINLDTKTGGRNRQWYSCMLGDHGLVAGGLNFRPTTTERIRNRFNCKGSLREGLPNCVGCGRCTVYCPADIDYVEVMKRVRGEEP
jgi:sulfhydrogenase subunit beta (sulfur reductase)